MKHDKLPSLAVFLLIGLSGKVAGDQIYNWSTIAGTPGTNGIEDGTNQGAAFYFPSGIAVDANGALFVADTQNNTIRKLRPEGTNWIVTTIAGSPKQRGPDNGTNTAARFNRPNGVAVLSSGNLLVVDTSNYTIRQAVEIGTNWVVSTIAGSPGVSGTVDGTNADASFLLPRGICAGSNGVAFIADTGNHTVRMLTHQGADWAVETIAGTPTIYDYVDGPALSAAFNLPFALATPTDGTMYIADCGNYAIRLLTGQGPDGEVTTIAGGTLGNTDSTGTNAQFNLPAGIAVDLAGNVYVTDQNNHTIRKLSAVNGDWQVTTIGGMAGQPGMSDGDGSDARFTKSWGIAVDAAGIIYVADYGNHTIRKGVTQSTGTVKLAFSMAPGVLTLYWDGALSDYILESSDSPTGGSWNKVDAGITSQNGQYVYVVTDFSSPSQFYRLRKP